MTQMEMSSSRAMSARFHSYGNQLNGTLPTSIGNFSKLVFLDLDNNQLHGNIPSISLGNLSKLSEILALESDLLTGTIPSEIGNLSSLYQVRFEF